MTELSKIMEHTQIKKFPSEGFCRVPTCGVYYSRATSGRKGMCKSHYTFTSNLVNDNNNSLTWEEVDKAWPEAVPWTGLNAPDISLIRMSETEFQNGVIDYITRNGHGVWMLDATRRKGIPDLLIVTKEGKVLFRELKATEGTKPEEAQMSTMKKLKENGANVGIWVPADLQSGFIAQELSE